MNAGTIFLIAIISAAVVAIIGLAVYAWIKRDELSEWLHRPDVRAKIADMCRQAEKVIIGSGMGQERLIFVVNMLYKYVPPNIAIFIPPEIAVAMMKAIIHEVFESIAVTMEDGSRKAV